MRRDEGADEGESNDGHDDHQADLGAPEAQGADNDVDPLPPPMGAAGSRFRQQLVGTGDQFLSILRDDAHRRPVLSRGLTRIVRMSAARLARTYTAAISSAIA